LSQIIFHDFKDFEGSILNTKLQKIILVARIMKPDFFRGPNIIDHAEAFGELTVV